MTLRPHVHLHVSHLESAIAFYSALFGVAPTAIRPTAATYDLCSPALLLVLYEHPDAQAAAGHFGVVVASGEALDALVGELQQRGLSPERSTDRAWLRDPDGTAWELVHRA